MARRLRKGPGIRERAPDVWELVVEVGRDPVDGRRIQMSRTFHGTMSEAKKARTALLAEVGRGQHSGTNATVDDLFEEWIIELERKGRSPSTIHNYRKTYNGNIKAILGSKKLRKVTTKMLTDLYGAHQRRGLKPRTVHQIHATYSSMFAQACRWGWIDSNPAQWAEPPSLPDELPVVPTPEEVRKLIEASENSRRPEYARAMFVSATTGLRRGELCALKRKRDVDWDGSALTVAWNVIHPNGQVLTEAPTKNRRIRRVALDEFTLDLLRTQVEVMEKRAASAGVELLEDCYIFSDTIDGSEPWKPGAVTQYFSRLRKRVGLDHLNFHSLRKFMETYGQDLGYSAVQVALRAGHDPSVAAKHYTGKVAEADRALADSVAGLLRSEPGASTKKS